MKSEISSVELRYIIKEFQELKDSKVDKVYMPAERDIILSLHLPNVGKRLLRILPNIIYLTSIKPENPMNPYGFCTYLRKKLTNARVRSVVQHGFERIMIIEFESKEAKYFLIIELFSKGNIILCDKDMVILSPLEVQHWKGREIKPKEKYLFPEARKDPFKLAEKEFSEIIKGSDKENISKKIAIELGFGGLYAEEICAKAGVDFKKIAADNSDLPKLYHAMIALEKKELEPCVVYEADKVKEICPFNLNVYKDLRKEPYESLNLAIDSVLSKQIEFAHEQKSKSKYQKEIEKLERIIDEQRKTITSFQEKAKEEQRKAEIIFEKYQLIDSILKELRKAMQKYNMQEIKAKLKGHEIIKEVNEKDKTICIEI